MSWAEMWQTLGRGYADLRWRWTMTVAVAMAPRVTIATYGNDEARRIHAAFSARHPRIRIIPSKRWGVGLLRLPDTFDAYLREVSTSVRRGRKRALDRGYRFELVRPLAHLDDIIEVNRSAPERQGRAMEAWYVDPDRIRDAFRGDQPIGSVLDSLGRLRAYTVVPTFGDACVLSRLLGHAAHLDDGVMPLLITETIRWKIAERDATGAPLWIMYDTFWGARPGLVDNKRRYRFQPYTVTWRWTDQPPAEARAEA
jgi:hypothetical protein